MTPLLAPANPWPPQAGNVCEETLTVLSGVLWYNCSIANANERRMLLAPAPVLTIGKGDFQMATPDYTTRICPVCGKEYQADQKRLKFGRQTTCSRECSYKYRASKLSVAPVELTCTGCGKHFYKLPCEIRGNFCSLECYHAYRNPEGISLDKHCAQCGKAFHARSRRHKFCSRRCFELSHKIDMAGDGNPSYIDGRSVHANYDAGSNWHEIRRAVYRRDNYTCQLCGEKCVAKNNYTPETSHLIIQCHHIKPYKDSRNNALENLLTLCLRCHREIHLQNV